jgi:hypothetical protein
MLCNFKFSLLTALSRNIVNLHDVLHDVLSLNCLIYGSALMTDITGVEYDVPAYCNTFMIEI